MADPFFFGEKGPTLVHHENQGLCTRKSFSTAPQTPRVFQVDRVEGRRMQHKESIVPNLNHKYLT